MKRNKSFLHVLLVGLLLALAGSGGPGLAQGPEPPQGEPQLRGKAAITATVDSKFSYQGVLKENGSPANGSWDMTFRLYSDDTCTTQVGDPITQTVPITNGLFSVELDVTHSDFNGQGLWLEVQVGNIPISCQEILPVPYALGLKPGAIVEDEDTSVQMNRLRVNFPGGEIYREGIYAAATGAHDINYGVYGYANNSSTNYGVYGHSEGFGGAGVYGLSEGYGPGIVGYSVYGSGLYGYSENGAAVYGAGDFQQPLPDNGLVKAAVSAYCQGPTGSNITRSFNNVDSDPITIADGPSEGRCTIDFPFSISQRFWVATAEHDEARGVSCQLGSSPNQLECIRWRADTGEAFGGPIMVLVY